MLLSKGNEKLGILPSFSLPVITTCPGKTPFCERFCYGLKGRFQFQPVKDANERRLDATLRPDFVERMVKEIIKVRSEAIRVHVVGDFYSVEYIQKWIDIAGQLPEIVFWGSTRAWRCDALAPAIKVFRDLKNVFLKASIDPSDLLDPYSCGWNVWSIEGDGLLCRHDQHDVASCYECGRCWKKRDVNISFKLRWKKSAERR